MAGVAVAAMTSLLPAPATAQDNVVVMRRVIAKPNRTPTPTPTGTIQPGQPGYYSWTVTPWTQTGTCGAVGTQTRGVTCRRTDGTDFPDSYCTGNGSGQKPVTSQPVLVTATCSYSWQESAWSLPTTTCGASTLARDVSCVRSDQTIANGNLCPQPAPPSSSIDRETSGCGYQWTASEWSKPSVACGDGTESRTVSCMRTDGVGVPAAQCAGDPPVTSQRVYVTCSGDGGNGGGGTVATGFHWVASAWGAPVPSCGNTVSTRSVVCEDSTGSVYADAQCTGDRPATTEPATSYATCTDGRTADHPYGWTVASSGAASTSCGFATITHAVACTDINGGAVDDSLCVTPKPSGTTTATITSGCSYHWETGDFGAPQPSCGPTVQSRAVYCQRTDGANVIGEYCAGQQEPVATQSATDFTACTFGWTMGGWSQPSTNCGAATETRTIACQRADGTTVDDGSCDPASRPTATQNSYETSGCGVSWKIGDWAVTPGCGASIETRGVTCLRSDGQTVDDGQCAALGDKPETSKAINDYQTCSFSWNVGEFPAPSSTCGTTTQTRSVSCLRSDGQTVDDGQCSGQGDKPVTSETTTQTSTCTYAWSPEAWGAATPACGASTHSRTVDCQRSDHTNVAASLCTGSKPATSEATTDYSTCGYSWQADAWQGAAGCGDTVTQTRNVYCLRSDGAHVADGLCGDSSTKPASTQPITDYSQCSYSWQQTVGTWSATCSASATRTNVVTCARQDGQIVDDSYCSAATKPSTTDTGNYAGCTYAGTYGAPLGTCNPTSSGSTTGKQTTTLSTCKRSDGADVTSENVGKNYSECAKNSTQSCTPTYTGTYSYGACTPSSQGATSGSEAGTVTKCTAPDGSSAPLSACSGTTSRTCSGITYAETYGTCSGSSAPISTCTTTASDGISGTVASNLCPAAAQTQTCSSSSGGACGLPVQGVWDGGTATGTLVTHATTGITSAAAAQAFCNQQAAIYHTRGVCIWESDSTKPAYYIENDATNPIGGTTLYGANCTASVTCGTEVGGRTISGQKSFTKVGTYTTLEAGRQACQTFSGVNGVCYIENNGTNVYDTFYATGASVATSTNSWTYSAACTK